MLTALEDSVVYFYGPTDLQSKPLDERRIRVGGLVVEGSVDIDGMDTKFDVSDGNNAVTIAYRGALPDLFREGQGIIAEGVFDGRRFNADTVLAKHDETYMPKEVAETLKEQGVWQGEGNSSDGPGLIGLAEIGHFSLALGLASALVMATLPLIGAQTGNGEMLRAGRMAAGLLTAQVLLAFIMLTIAFLRSDFSVELVASHSHSLKPLLYKISGVWGNHEGSLLLWVLILSLFSLMVALRRSIEPRRQGRVLAVQGMIAVAFLLFVLLTSNPFLRLEAPPLDGNGLNPLLQDPGLAFHPPMLYIGYVGLSVAFSFAVAALLEGKADKDWANEARPFILAAWAALTLGIALGSWWAYYELGWGGWWFWDPVENASLMPWLIATALIHSVVVVENRDSFKTWTVLLAILGFALSLLGTFIVRSGLLTSVHSFASDPARGMVILAILAVSIGGPLTLFALRGDKLASRDDGAMISRESALIANNLLLVVATATVLIGTLYPLGLEAWNGARISVGPPFYNATFSPLMGLMVLMMAGGPLLAWQRADGMLALRRMLPALGLVIAAVMITAVVTDEFSVAAMADRPCDLAGGRCCDRYRCQCRRQQR